MVSEENRLLLASLAVVLLAAIAVGATGVAADRPLVSAVVVALSVLLPQAVLAYRRVGEIAPMTRVRFAVAASVVVVLATLVPVDGNEWTVGAVVAALLVGWLAVEVAVASRGRGTSAP
jgi:hypothetical protein